MALILLVDDDPILRASLRRILNRGGLHSTVEACNGREALRACESQIPDLVITDLIMPEMEGLETMLELRRRYPGIRLIAMSGGGRLDAKDYLQAAGKMGATGTLCKPFDAAELLASVEKALKASPA